jgi:hypothetical protein
MTKILLNTGPLEDAPVWSRQFGPIGRDDDHVRSYRHEDLVVPKLLVQRREHGGHQPIVQIVKVNPLSEDPVRLEILLDPVVELCGKQARYSAHPGIGGLGEDEVVLFPSRREVGLGIVDDEYAAGILEHSPVGRQECPGRLDHLRLDLDRRQVLEMRASPAGYDSTSRCPGQ